jgi:hypothetical protein
MTCIGTERGTGSLTFNRGQARNAPVEFRQPPGSPVASSKVRSSACSNA